MEALKRYVLKRCAAVNVVSNAMTQTIAGLGIDHRGINVIPMGVDLKNTFIPGEQAKTSKSLLFVGRFAEKKGLIYLINAMPTVLDKHPDARLTIVGHGPLKHTIIQRIAELGLQHAIHIAGAVENAQLPAIYQTSQIVVFPPLSLTAEILRASVLSWSRQWVAAALSLHQICRQFMTVS